ncbi:SMI1/KNR4 family protein [Dactylosporangium sp. NPDC051485]|uniref:SMI1/KNR4 family protein n=1 Tax=Dactylosporangium sp. NPDC051485 TaxID=3154846 RepID=UPI003443A256
MVVPTVELQAGGHRRLDQPAAVRAARRRRCRAGVGVGERRHAADGPAGPVRGARRLVRAVAAWGMSLLPYEAMLTCWRYWAVSAAEFQGRTPQLADAGTHYDWPAIRSWLPVAENDDSSIVLDFQPGPGGTVGQVLFPLDEVNRVVVASSLTDFLRRWLAALDRGDVRFDADYGYALPVDPSREYADVLRNDGEPDA